MIAGATPVQRVLLYEGTGSQAFEPDQRQRLLQSLLEQGFSTGRILATDGLRELGHRSIVILGQFANQVPKRLAADGSDIELQVRDVTAHTTDQILDLVRACCETMEGSTANGWKPWFPVIDFDRCTNCMQCLSFCLFDVYGVTNNGKITVQNENNCKTDCPACSRVCPEVAILFPKYKAGPINGDEVSAEDVRREAMKVDISALLGGDIYTLLRDRSAKAKSRFSKERDDERALKERQRCLTKLQEDSDLGIPAEVLATLPSFDEIQEKAREAKRKAQAALNQNQTSDGQ